MSQFSRLETQKTRLENNFQENEIPRIEFSLNAQNTKLSSFLLCLLPFDSGGLGRFFPAWANFLSQKISPGWAWAILNSSKTSPGQNGPIKKRPGPKWADFVSFLGQNGEVKIIMSLILHLDTGKIQNTYYEIHF